MPARTYAPTPANLKRLAQALQRGELVAIPTETVYGLAAHALDARACRAIFHAKGRPPSDPLIVHVLDLAHAEELAEFNDAARRVAVKFWPGPLTLVLPKKACVPGIVTSGGETVGLRAPAHPLARRLLRLARVPLAAPSANPFSYISPTSAAHVQQGLGKRIKHILDGGECAVGVESTVLDLTNPKKPVILRPGAIDEALLGRVLRRKVRVLRKAKSKGMLRAPGLLEKHYSPQTPLHLLRRPVVASRERAVILLRHPAGKLPPHTYTLSKRGALAEIAHNLYRILREADAAGYREILVEPVPPTAGGLAAAINDRIRRATAR
jgi:L-threonylcarbamoyladenylate synthase